MDSDLYGTPRSTERTSTTTRDNLRVTERRNEPPVDGLQAAVPQTAQHNVDVLAHKDFPHHTTPPQRSDQPTNPTAIPDGTRALPTRGTLRP